MYSLTCELTVTRTNYLRIGNYKLYMLYLVFDANKNCAALCVLYANAFITVV